MEERNAPAAQVRDEQSVAWNKLPWRKLEQHVYRIQKRIYRASQRGETRKVEKLQKLLLKSRIRSAPGSTTGDPREPGQKDGGD